MKMILTTRKIRDTHNKCDNHIYLRKDHLMKQNITLSIDKEILKKGRILAVQRDTSVSKMLSDFLEQMVEGHEQYQASKRKALQNLNKGFHMGGKIDWKREELYER